MPPRRRKRLDPALFQIPVEAIRQGDHSSRSALRARETLIADGHTPRVTVQISAERGGIVGGTDEAVAVLKLCADDWATLVVQSLYDGDRVEPFDTVMTIEGEYQRFAHLESLLLGILSHRTRIATNVRTFVDAARPKLIIAYPARHDHWLVQAGDAHAAHIGGAVGLSSDMGLPDERKPPTLASLPHSLITAYGGDTRLATEKFAAHLAPDVEIIVPVDYENDAVRTSLDVARAFDGRLWGVRLDTPEHMVDTTIIPMMGSFPPAGVNPTLVWAVRNALDAEGFGDVRILVSGGFTVERILAFEEDGVAVDAYGIGAALFSGRWGFTGDVVKVGDAIVARAGREPRANPKLERVK